MPGLADTYPFCTYSLTSFADIPAPAIRPARFVDVIGKIEMVSDIVPMQSIYQTVASNTRTIILKDLLGNELRLVLWGERVLEFDAEAVHAMGVKEPVIAIFVGTLPKMSHGPGAIVPRVFEAPIEKTTQELNDADPFVDMEKKFLCTVKVDRLGADQRWWFASCSVCRKSARHDGYQFQCSGKDCASIDAALVYCVSFFASDATGETEFVMFEKVAAGAIGKQLLPLMRQRYPGYTTVGELAQAAKRDTAIPSEIERLIGQKYKLLVSISKRWNSGNSENLRYQVCRIEETYKPQLPPLTFLASHGASSSSAGLGATLPPLGPSQSPMQSASPALGSHLSQVTRGAAATPPPREPVTPARGMSSAPKRCARPSLFTSPSKDKSQLGEDDPLAADGDLLLGEETVTEPLVEAAPADAISVDSDKANQTVIPKTKSYCTFVSYAGVTSEELLVPLSVPAMLRNTMDESCSGPVAYISDEAHFPAPRLVKISCKMMFGVMLANLGLPNARYNSYVHEDGEVSAVVTFYSPSRFVGEGLEQLKIGGSLAATSEIAEDSAAREGIRHIEVSEDVKIEDLHYTELTLVTKSYKQLLWKSMKKRRERENFEKQLSASVKRMAGSSRNIVSLISDSRSLGQGSEAVYYNEALARIEVVANELSQVAK
ncbi:hypothetical protein ACQ4PT_070153 [Festuca glaucescens]